MQKRLSRKKPPSDISQLAAYIVEKATGESTTKKPEDKPIEAKAIISKFMAEMGRKGGRVGGKRRLVTMTPEERSKIASKAAKARWDKKRKKA